MNDKDDFKTIVSATLRDGGSAAISFPVPGKLESFSLSVANVDRAIDYYLLARYAFLHRMHSAFMINSFWAVEHLILSILIPEIRTKDQLRERGEFHEITRYWNEAKGLVPEDRCSSMSGFDDYVGRVSGYFDERYPKPTPAQGKLTHTGKMPRVVSGGGESGSAQRFGKVAPLSLDELDHFVNFMLHDITVFSKDCSVELMKLLASQKNQDLYSQDNKYSVVYPNKKYHGEGN